jgi:hypothetical protein
MSGKGSDYRPLTDVMLLAPSKVKYYGGYPNGLLQRARCLLCRMDEPLLHVCSGRVRDYPGYGFGPFDRTLDINPALEPDFCQDAREKWPTPAGKSGSLDGWPAILADPPYTEWDAMQYHQYWAQGKPKGELLSILPSPNELCNRAMEALRPGGKFGLLHYRHPKLPKGARLVACISVIQGQNGQARCFTVIEKEYPMPKREEPQELREARESKAAPEYVGSTEIPHFWDF